MERRSYRPYLRQNGTDSVDKFLKNINSTNNHNNERYTSSKFPTDGLDGAGTSKYPSYSTYVGKYSPSLRNTVSSSAAPGNYSTRYDAPTAERRRPSGVPLYNLAKNTTYNAENYGANGSSRFAQGGYNDYGAQRTGSIPTVRDGAKKQKSALKSLRSFFKRHLIGGSRGRRDLSATPINTRFSSTQNVNGHLPYAVPTTHRRSSSSSIGFINENRPQQSSSAFNSSRDSIVKRSSTVLPFNNVDYSRPSTVDSLDSSIKDVQRRTGDISISKADISKRPPLPSTTKFTPNKHPSVPIPDTSNVISDRQLAQKRPTITPDERTPTIICDRNPKTIIPCLRGLLNHGNTCYFSAIIQCLAACERFAEFLICNDSEFSDHANRDVGICLDEDGLYKSFVSTLRCLWFNNPNADSFCLKTLRFIGQANPLFIISHQQTYKSEEELASDALEKISGSHESTVMDLFRYDFISLFILFFRGQFRTALKCTNPGCGFTNLSFEPYLCISLSVPLAKKLHHYSVLLFSFHPTREIIRFYFAVPETSLNVRHFKNKIMERMNGSSEETVSCCIEPNGLIQLLDDDFVIYFDNRQFGELNILEIPKILPTHKNDDTIVCIVVFVMGTLPNCERNFLLQKCERLLPRHFSILPQDYNIFVQSRDNSLQVLHPQTKRPLFSDFVERILNDVDNPKKVLRIIIEWDLSLKQRFLSYVAPEPILNDYSFYRKVESSDYDSKQSTISLTNLLDQFVGCESIRDWTCPNCTKSPGSMELRFHSLPDVLVFHLKRFELLSESVTKKIDSRVKIPLEKLDMSPYVYSQYSKSSTLPKNKKGGNKTFNYVEKNLMIYDLAGVIYHYGERTNSGHYTAATLNPVDGKWRIFDDSRVSTLAESVTGSSELEISSRSYLLFYQRQPYLQRKLTWFPQNVPEHIIKKYQKKEYSENVDRSYANGNSIFYKDNSDPTLKESYLKSPTKSLTQERIIPIIRETRAGPAVGYVPEFTSSYTNRNF
ncbi:unnamed protein product [Meloidogyne enterolobii]|uniref:Uncharacterized protein n=1 Tax=Meloidogyne enterolobii TaxID=390850 RepID=A0ACB0Z7S5_MELEN